MITFEDVTKLFSCNLEGKFCIEIEFLVKEEPKYQTCQMGKMPDRENKQNESYWYGLVSDGSEAYDYNNFQNFSNAPVFNGKSLKEIWKKVEIISIDGCDPDDRIKVYL